MNRQKSRLGALRSPKRRIISVGIVTLALGMVIAPTTNAGVVISQVYGGGGNSGAPLTHDFIELFNNSSTSQSLAGWSVQYASATGTGLFGATTAMLTELSSVVLQAGQYFLIQEVSQAAVGVPLPTPDLIDATPIAMSATAGKVALVSGTTPLGCNGGSTPCDASQLLLILDLVGYGGANFFEGAGAAPTLSNTTAAFRADGGCSDTNQNNADFTAGAPSPRNTASSLNVCSGGAPTIPEPATLALFGLGIAGLGLMRRRRAA